MRIQPVFVLSRAVKEQLYTLWNQEYPEEFYYKTISDLDDYLGRLAEAHHYLLVDDAGKVHGWAFTFVRDQENWFGIILDGKLHGKGFGRRMIDFIKTQCPTLNGWVTLNTNNVLKHDGQAYHSPLAFYLKQGFRKKPDATMNIGQLVLGKISWQLADAPYTIRRFQEADMQAYKTMRLEALQMHPGFFGNSYEMEAGFPAHQWTYRLKNPAIATFGLYHGAVLVGITSIVTHKEQQDEAYMSQSYIQRAHRGRRLSRLLYEARLAFAKAWGITRLVIGHRESNLASKAANQHFGFTYTHREARTWPDGSTEDMVYYVLHL